MTKYKEKARLASIIDIMREENMKNDKMFLEVADLEIANNVDLSVYRFERFSDKRNVYIFVKRKV